MQKCKNIKNTTIQKTLGFQLLVQKRKREQNIKTAKTAKKRRKGPCASYFPQNFQMIYRDSTKNNIKNMGRLLISFAN